MTVHENAIPCAASIKSTGFGHGLTADDITDAFNVSIANDIRANRQRGLPIAGYDADKKQAYLESTDGTREYFNAAKDCLEEPEAAEDVEIK